MAVGRIPDNVLEDILSRIDISEVISGYIPLKRAGRNFKALCPFHQEKTASFMVSTDRQIYHCFGCGESGNAFKFLMRYERLEFPEAVEILAKKAGVVLPEIKPQDSGVASLAAQVYKINELATLFYENNLNSPAGLKVKNYLLRRGIKEETIKSFKLGYALDKWDGLINHLRAKGVSLFLIEKAGLIISKDSGGYYDRFRSRLIFPILDIKSRPVGFGARVLDDSLPKYINSPETPIYTKGKNLYGLNLAKDSIRELDTAVIVEGYMDFMLPYQEGIKNIVASQGTALTYEQARLLKRYTQNVVMVYDGDSAGEIAALRSLDIFIEEEMDVKVVSLPKGFDPDLFIRQKSAAEFKEKVKEALGLFDYKLKILKTRHDIKKVEGKRDIAKDMLATISKFKNAILKSEYIKKLSEELGVAEHYIVEEINKIKGGTVRPDFTAPAKKAALDISPTEKLLIKLMLEEKELIERIKECVDPADFHDARAAKVVSVMFELMKEGKNIEPNVLMSHFSDDDISQIVCESVFMPELSAQDKEKVLDDCVRRLKDEKLKLKKQHLHEEIKSAQRQGDEKKLNTLMQEFHGLIKKG